MYGLYFWMQKSHFCILLHFYTKQRLEIVQQTDVLIIGSGIAGCISALLLASKNIEVILVTATEDFKGSNSYFAQGGIIYRGEDDSEDLLAQDITNAGGGLCLKRAVEQLVSVGAQSVKEILVDDLKVDFDLKEDGSFSYTEEAAHSRSRILHHKDHTGKIIMKSLQDRLEEMSNVQILQEHIAVDLITLAHHSTTASDIYKKPTCVGAYVLDKQKGEVNGFFAKETILATGGLGEVFLHTTNPSLARGDGVAMAYRAGARIMNMEYIQFHPTSLYVPNERRFLLSEALRGEGAELLSQGGEPFMHLYHEKKKLAARDVVARGIYMEMLKTSGDHVWLDISFKDSTWVKDRFPSIYEYCLSKGYDMTKEPLPIVPAAHYSCGGIAVDLFGQTSLNRLRAIGEVSCTGVHGANRLASSALLEGLVWGRTCAENIAEHLAKYAYYFPKVNDWVMGQEEVDASLISQDWISIKQTMWNYVGLVRDQRRLRRAMGMLRELQWEVGCFYEKTKLTPGILGLRNGIETALLITQGAVRNRSSVGCHYRKN